MRRSSCGGAAPDACEVRIPLGMDGKPFFVSGPYDNAPAVPAQLTQAVGASNFDYVVAIGAPPDFPDKHDEEEDEQEA